MGCDVSFLKKIKHTQYEEHKDKRILMLGLDNAGKTSILLQLKENTFMSDSVPTIGLNIEQIQYKTFNLTFWDVGGQATRLWKHYFDSVSGIVYVIDSTDKTRLIKARDELHRVSRDEGLAGVPFLILINKWDLEDHRMEQKLIE